MTDVLQEAQLGGPCPYIDDPCDPPPRQCNLIARDDRTNGPVQAGSQHIQNIYFVPNDIDPKSWDRPVACSDGSRFESNIGYSAFNGRIFMSASNNQGGRVRNKAINHLFRTVQAPAWGYTFKFYGIMYIRGLQPHAFYTSDPHGKIKAELAARGWNATGVKYLTYANVTSSAQNSAGKADYNATKATVFMRWQSSDGTVKGVRWGCGDFGDVAPMQEQLHEFGAVQTAAPEHDFTHTYHTTQMSDVMYHSPGTTFSGRTEQGIPTGVTQWDPGLDSYTNRILTGFPGYLGTIPNGFSIHANCT